MKERFSNIFYLLKSFLFFPVFGSAKKNISDPKKVLVIQMARLGDMVCTTPMFRAIKKHYPRCTVTVVGNFVNKEVLSDNTDVDGYIVFENKISKMISLLKKEKFDCALFTTPHYVLLVSCYLSGIPCIVTPKITGGFSPQETHSYRLLRNIAITQDMPMGSYVPREYLRRLEPIGIITSDTKKCLAYSEKARNKIEKIFNDNRIKKDDFVVAISPSAGNKIKNWKADRFASIADLLYEKYSAVIFIIGGSRDKNEVQEMISHVSAKTKVIDLSLKLSIDDLKAFISQTKLFMGVDTGPVYIAEAFNVPTIDITGPIDEREQPPIGEMHIAVVPKNRRRPELFVANAKVYNHTEAQRQVDSISVAQVADAIRNLYPKILTYHNENQ